MCSIQFKSKNAACPKHIELINEIKFLDGKQKMLHIKGICNFYFTCFDSFEDIQQLLCFLIDTIFFFFERIIRYHLIMFGIIIIYIADVLFCILNYLC